MVRRALYAAALGVLPSLSMAAQLGLVVGINDYAHFVPYPAPPGEHSDLQGAVNDALRIYEAMQDAGVDVPRERLLIDGQATVAGFLAAWQQLLDASKPGDTLIVTYAGHGGQEREVSAPLDETTDGLDETLMFHDFNPADPREGRLTDDQLQKLLADSADYAVSVIWVMDSCHSAGLVRSAATQRGRLTRNGGVWDIPLEPLVSEIPASSGDNETPALPHVTQILATATEDRQVQETVIDGKVHGALSWYFAEAIGGAADIDNSGITTRSEIADYLSDRVFSHMNQNQQPRILPRGDNAELLGSGRKPEPKPEKSQPAAAADTRLPVTILGAAPPGLARAEYREVTAGAALTFEQTAQGWTVYNHTGDRIADFTSDADRFVHRAALIQAVQKSKSDDIPAVGITADQTYDVSKIGDVVGFRFDPPTESHAFATLFNIASNGTLQNLFPIGAQDDLVGTRGLPIRFQVTPPSGADQLVASFCTLPPLELRRLLTTYDNKAAPRYDEMVFALAQGDCQLGWVGLYTGY